MGQEQTVQPEEKNKFNQSLTAGESEAGLIEKLKARINQLKQEIASRCEENTRIVSQNLQQNEILNRINQDLDGIVRERTAELEKSKKELEENNKILKEINESKEAVMHMIVHDMKNPLTVVMGALCLSQNARYPMDPDLKGLLKDGHIQAIKLRIMIDDILTISRMRSAEFQVQATPTELISLTQQSVMVMNVVKGSRKLTFQFQTVCESLIVNIDYQMIERVINNVLNNAIKYAPDDSQIQLEIIQEGEFAKIVVTNWGEAIPAEAHKKIFEMFGRAKPQDKKVDGTGLGLAFCQLAIEAHKGKIWVVSPVPPQAVGAQFVFTLPLYHEPPNPPVSA